MSTAGTATVGPDRVATPGPPRRARVDRPTGRRALTAVLAVTVAVVLASLLVGSRTIGPAALWDPAHAQHHIALARFPRTALALAVGAALALAGACMQGLTRNPLADPGILGVTAGASFAMVVGMSFLGVAGLTGHLFLAFAGAAVASVVVHALAGLGRGGATPVKLAIAGAALSAALTSWTSAVLLVDARTMEVFRFWQVGTVGGRGWEVLVVGAPFLVLGALLAAYGARVLDLLALGDDLARGLGRRVRTDRLVVGLAIVLLAGGATALAGPIAFVGLVVPHAVRALVGAHHGRLLAWSALGGALLTVAADTVGRVVLPPTEVQVGIMTAVVGVPFFFHLIRRGQVSGL